MKILLIGNPNVGKSVVFSRLTGTNVIASNYPGTTVEFTKGYMHLPSDSGEIAEIIDIPGIYTLDEPSSKAEQVALEMLEQGDIVLNVVNATALERGLNLTLQLLQRNIPLVIALNMWDEAGHTGISIDAEKLEQTLGVPCVPTTAVTGQGFKELVSRIKDAKPGTFSFNDDERWQAIGNIIEKTESIIRHQHTFRDKLADASISPVSGLPIAAAVLYVSFLIIRTAGEALITYVFSPLFEHLWAPVLLKMSSWFQGRGIIHDILIGRLSNGEIDFEQSFGLLSTGLYVPVAAVFPYVCAFYLVLSFLEDSGYLPRLAVLADNLMHRLGIHGNAILPMMLGFGCNVPGVLSTRIMETDRERFITATLMVISVPCMAQLGMIVGLLQSGQHGMTGLTILFATLLIVWIVLGLILNKTIKGESMEIFLEIPPYRIPYIRGLAKKLWMRIVWFFKDAIPWVIAGVFIANILYVFGIINFLGTLAAPVVSGVLGLPKDAVGALTIGFLRKDVAVGMLVPLHMNLRQLIIASVVLTMYFPCAATFATLIRELGLKAMFKSALIMLAATLITGGLLNLVLKLAL